MISNGNKPSDELRIWAWCVAGVGEGPPVESRGSERTRLLSKLLLRKGFRCSWIQS